MADIVHEAQDTHLCALFIKAHGDGGDYEYALDAQQRRQTPASNTSRTTRYFPTGPRRRHTR